MCSPLKVFVFALQTLYDARADVRTAVSFSRTGPPCQESHEEGHEGQEVSEVAYLFCRRGFGFRRQRFFQVFLIFELASLRGGGRTRAFILAVIRWRPFGGKGARACACSCFH